MLAQSPPNLPSAANTAAAAAAAPRKRRRRAPATGAPEDCFACRGKGVKCDRKRPYCGPCLEVGTECSGYRTQLTWGVGVASRGKLRGMSLPISLDTSIAEKKSGGIKKKSVDATTPRTPVARTRSSFSEQSEASELGTSVGTETSASTGFEYGSVDSSSGPLSPTSTLPTPTAPRAINHAHRHSMHIRSNTSSPFNADVASSLPSLPQIPQQHKQNRLRPHSIHFQNPSYNFSTSASSVPSPLPMSPMSEFEPVLGIHTPYSLSPANSSTSLYDMGMNTSSAGYHHGSLTATSMPYSSHVGARVIPQATSHPSIPPMHHDLNSHDHGSPWSQHSIDSPQSMHGSGNLSDLLYNDDILAFGEPEFTFSPPQYSTPLPACTSAPSDSSHSLSHTSLRNLSINTSVHVSIAPPHLAGKTPELRFLLDYYDRSVCPALVAFDTPSNPYRAHILRLAFHNEALMEAVSALASSHWKQKRDGGRPERKFGSIQYGSSGALISPISSMDDLQSTGGVSWDLNTQGGDIEMFDSGIDVGSDPPNLSPGLEHKNASIRLLNAQLANPALATTDSAMATLLLLCLYHVCETGTGQFRTHLAGVKKLMGMRGIGKSSQRWTWMETVFTWLDNMSAPINNRHTQLEAMDYFGTLTEASTDEWDIESLTGCDRHLFLKISKLSRVNMLSQTAPSNPSRRWFTSTEMEDDEWEEPVRNENDGRHDFWEAWRALREELVEWTPSVKFAAKSSRHRNSDAAAFSPSSYQTVDSGFASLASSSPNSPTIQGFRNGACASPRKMSFKAQEAVENNHWLHASNVWRSAAILYLDRLAYPHLSSSHPVFQNTVRKVLDHMNCIPTTSGLSKLLFWPMFVVGSECVVDSHRAMVRQRCYEMHSASGFCSKIAGLNILEKIWDSSEEILQDPELDESMGGRGLRWRRSMAAEDGEYLMI